MRSPSAKHDRIRLNGDAYRALHQEIVERDGWRCQACGSLSGLEVHHMRRRSRLGDDVDRMLAEIERGYVSAAPAPAVRPRF